MESPRAGEHVHRQASLQLVLAFLVYYTSPAHMNVHYGQVHVGGSTSLSAAGVRTECSPPTRHSWAVQTGKPPALGLGATPQFY